MSLLLVDLGYLGIKTCFYVSKYIGVTTFNLIAYMSGSPTLSYFTKTREDILIEEVKNLRGELVIIKELIGKRPQEQIEYIYIDEVEPIKELINDKLEYPSNNKKLLGN